MLEIGQVAPQFTLPDQNGKQISLKDFSGRWVILYFYPRALTPGCTVQACGLRDAQNDLQKLNATAIGISADKPQLLKKFEDKHQLNFTLLGDESHGVLEQYEAWGEKSLYGKKYMGIFRITYLIDPQGKVAYAMPKVQVKQHHEDMINLLKELQNKG